MYFKPTQRARSYKWLFIVFLALVIRVGYCAWTHRGPYAFAIDYREYIITAQRLLEHRAFLSPLVSDASRAEPSALMPPLYTIWVASIYALFGVESRESILVLELANAVALALACGLVFKIAELLSGRRAAWTAGLIAALNPALIGHTNYIWDTSFFALTVTLSVWISLWLRERPFSLLSFFGVGIWLGIVALLNPALTLAYPLLVLLPLWRFIHRARRDLVLGVGACVVGWMIAIGPWTIRNFVQLGELHYVRSGLMTEVWLGATPEAEQAGADVFRKHFALKNPEVARHVAAVGEQNYIRECGAFARRAIAEDPIRFAKLVLMKTVDFWFGTVLTHASPQQKVIPATRQRKLIMLVFTVEVALLFFAVMRGWFTRTELWLLGVVVVFSCVYSLTHVQVRFRVPIEPVIAVLAGIAIVRAEGRINSSKVQGSASQ